ncbi:MAG: peptidylprolyl isomerase [Anaerolineae bacterium]
MTSRKQKIKEKRSQQEREERQVQIAVAVFVLLVVIGIGGYVLNQSGAFEPSFEALSSDYVGTLDEICEEATPASGGGASFLERYDAPPGMGLDDGVDYQAIFCTSEGAIYVDLYEDRTPITVNNFVFLSTEGYYNNSVFHRVLEGFMAQGGDPTGTGRGGPGYTFTDEILPDQTFDRAGLLAMANSGPNTNGGQFFITYGPATHLDSGHTIFGEVLSGQEALDALVRVDPQRPDPSIVPSDLQTVVIVTPEQVTQ